MQSKSAEQIKSSSLPVFLIESTDWSREGEKGEEKYYTAMQPPSVPCGRDGMSGAQEAMKEESHE